ncbi:hypothetical protein ACJX0J_029043, partial [Zea mays]
VTQENINITYTILFFAWTIFLYDNDGILRIGNPVFYESMGFGHLLKVWTSISNLQNSIINNNTMSTKLRISNAGETKNIHYTFPLALWLAKWTRFNIMEKYLN